jgi:DNA polymerase I-like protein with 3'-5' exonuclease and polymerase domains
VAAFPDLSQFKVISLDCETTGLHFKLDSVFGISMSTPSGEDYYWDIRRTPQAVEWLRDEIQHYKGTVVFANASFDVKMLSNYGISFDRIDIDDVILRASCIDEHLMSYSLDNLAKVYLNEEKDSNIYAEMAEVFGGRPTRNVQMKNISLFDPDRVAVYAKKDTRLTLDLYNFQTQEIERQEIGDITSFEKSLIKTFIGMELQGIRVNEGYAQKAMTKLEEMVVAMQKRIEMYYGETINVNSPVDIKRVMKPSYNQFTKEWEARDGTVLKSTKSGGPSIDAEALRGMKDPGAAMILEQRSLIKTKDTFLGGHVLASAIDGRVYPSINQGKTETGGTGTGRLSIQNPAMQQIPSRNKKVAEIVKQCFLPDEGHVWVDADMASFEVRVFAHLSGDSRVIEQYQEDPKTDFHRFVAELTHLPRDAQYSGQANAKQLNLSMIFNVGRGAAAEKMGMDWWWDEFVSRDGEVIRYKHPGDEAASIIEHYHTVLPGVKKLMKLASERALSRGYIFTRYGRHIRFPRGWKVYKASGLLIQATAADINKENIKIIADNLDDGRLLLNTHDSYSMSIAEDVWRDRFEKVKSLIERPILKVPLLLELSGHGENWWQAVKKG